MGEISLDKIVTVSRDVEVQRLAREHAHEVFGADDLTDALELVQRISPSLILCDYRFDPIRIRELLLKADNRFADVPVVVVGSNGHTDGLDKEFAEVGGYHFLETSRDDHQLKQIINKIELTRKATKSETQNDNQSSSSRCERDIQVRRFFADDLSVSVSMVGKSPSVLNTLRMIRLVAQSQCNPILIVGETGTGKELAAKAIHTLRHPNEPFVAVNCAALTATLLESELFGHVKGAFTGADRDRTGLLELAGAGTLLLDEISEMPMDLQAKLLRVLQEKCFRKVGGTKNIPCNATIIASSNRNLINEIQANRFRRDLYYRLDVSPIVLAPLRSPERRNDIGLLAEYFLETSTICPQKPNKIESLTQLAVEALERHEWPGNVRELRNVIERAILLETTDRIGLGAIVINSIECGQASDNQTNGLIKGFSLAKAERELIYRALQETGWQKTRAAALLGITRATLYAKVKQYNIGKNSCIVKSHAGNDCDETVISPVSLPTC
ncbi:MAG: sigma-54-dependent Fis family transcriptional regulator [Sedimentisphaerales bacterium]|nr:sigma-54-dependent Fis family transcriptional regulator [Sedimentisphaerales bacterium]